MPALHDERLNIRPYVLALCFAWGLLCGFLAYVIPSEPDETTHPVPQSPTQAPEESEEAKLLPEEQVTVSSAAPPTRDGALTESLAHPPEPILDPEPPATKGADLTAQLADGFPPLMPLALNPAQGLTGLTAKRPSIPIEAVNGSPATGLPPNEEKKFAPSVEPPQLGFDDLNY